MLTKTNAIRWRELCREAEELGSSIQEVISLTPLNERERYVLKERMKKWGGLQERTLDSIGTELRVCRERVRQIESKALLKLRRRIEEGKRVGCIEDKMITLLKEYHRQKKDDEYKALMVFREIKIDQLDLTAQSRNALLRNKIYTLWDLLGYYGPGDLLKCKKCGSVTVNRLKEMMKQWEISWD